MKDRHALKDTNITVQLADRILSRYLRTLAQGRSAKR
jgi:hypothetical protein